MTPESELLRQRQEAAKHAGDRMMAILLDYVPCQEMKVCDVKFIAEYTRSVAFDALKKVEQP